MNTPVLTFFNNKGGVGKTSLVYHVAWMISQMGKRVIAIDLDPQSNLTAACCSETQLEQLWVESNGARGSTIFTCLEPLTDVGNLVDPDVVTINENLALIPGDLRLSGLEDLLSQEWGNALDAQNRKRAFRIESAFWTTAQAAAKNFNADIILADVGPNLGAINRAALIATDYIVIPLAADLFSLIGLRNTGPKLREWRAEWHMRLKLLGAQPFPVPSGNMNTIGYVLMQHMERLDRPIKSYQKWASRIAETYAGAMQAEPSALFEEHDKLGAVKHYKSLAPMAQEARKPIFELTSADGAIGSHIYGVKKAREDFRELALSILVRIGMQ